MISAHTSFIIVQSYPQQQPSSPPFNLYQMASTRDPSNALIITRSCFFQPIGMFPDRHPHPSLGGNPYWEDARHDVIMRYQLGIPLNTPALNALRDEPAYPHMVTCSRYIKTLY